MLGCNCVRVRVRSNDWLTRSSKHEDRSITPCGHPCASRVNGVAGQRRPVLRGLLHQVDDSPMSPARLIPSGPAAINSLGSSAIASIIEDRSRRACRGWRESGRVAQSRPALKKIFIGGFSRSLGGAYVGGLIEP